MEIHQIQLVTFDSLFVLQESKRGATKSTRRYWFKIPNYFCLGTYEQGHTLSIVNPALIKAFGQSKLRRNKTDKSDAKLIAEFAQSHRPAAWTPPPASFKDLQALVRRLENLLSARTKETNRLVHLGVNNMQAVFKKSRSW